MLTPVRIIILTSVIAVIATSYADTDSRPNARSSVYQSNSSGGMISDKADSIGYTSGNAATQRNN